MALNATSLLSSFVNSFSASAVRYEQYQYKLVDVIERYTSNMSQIARTPTSAALSGRKRSEPFRTASSSPLTADPVVASNVVGEGALA